MSTLLETFVMCCFFKGHVNIFLHYFMINQKKGQLRVRFSGSLKGLAAQELPQAATLNALAQNKKVQEVGKASTSLHAVTPVVKREYSTEYRHPSMNGTGGETDRPCRLKLPALVDCAAQVCLQITSLQAHHKEVPCEPDILIPFPARDCPKI